MIRSMTGFGDASRQDGTSHYFVEVRSLNSKYFKAVIRLPEELQPLEAELESQLRDRLGRGSVFLTIQYADSSASAAHDINENALSSYIRQLRALPGESLGEFRIDLAGLLHLPGVLQPPANEEQRLDSARPIVRATVDEACDNLVAMRAREGRALLQDLLTHRDVIASRLGQIAERAPTVGSQYETRLRTRIDAMLEEAQIKTIEPVDIIREIATYAERTDISEEINRLSGHIEQFAELLGSDELKPIGRTLDFLTQEMLREANTIASKCSDAEISRWTVEVKGAIDRIKEQVQNVE